MAERRVSEYNPVLVICTSLGLMRERDRLSASASSFYLVKGELCVAVLLSHWHQVIVAGAIARPET